MYRRTVLWITQKRKNFVFRLFKFSFFRRKMGDEKRKTDFLYFLMIFQSSAMSSTHSTLKNLAKNEEKSCQEIFASQKLKF